MSETKAKEWSFADRLARAGQFFWTALYEIYLGIRMNRIPSHKWCLPGLLIAIALLLHLDESLAGWWGFNFHLTLHARRLLVYFTALSGWISWGVVRAIQRNVLLQKLRDAFDECKLKGVRKYPSVISDTEIDAHLRCLLLKGNGVTKTDFEKERERLQTSLNISIVKFRQREEDRGQLEMLYTLKDLDRDVPLLNPGQYPVGTIPLGKSHEGDVAVDLHGMGHILVAGQTGGGKSNFLKVATSVLAANNPKAQISFLDFKGGMESADLKHELGDSQGNIRYFDGTLSCAQELVRVGDLLDTRVADLAKAGAPTLDAYLKDKNLRSTQLYEGRADPDLKRNYVIIDEAAQLGTKDASLERGLQRKAMAALNRVARQGRAAGVHLVVAVQRPDVASFDQTVKANLPGILCFPMPSQAASVSAIGSKRAFDLNPDIKGRAVWKFGPKVEEVQTCIFNDK